MRIKDVEALVGISKKNIRFYEDEKLLKPGRSEENSYRDYSMEDVCRLKKIKLLRKLNMPLGEIRSVFEGRIALPEAAARHSVYLNGEIRNITQARTVTELLASNAASVEALDVDAYLTRLENMEKEGVLFVNIGSRDIRKKYTGAAIACAAVVLMLAGIIALVLYGHSTDPLPTGLLAVLIMAPVLTAGGTIAALISRIKEIRGGEENDLGKY